MKDDSKRRFLFFFVFLIYIEKTVGGGKWKRKGVLFDFFSKILYYYCCYRHIGVYSTGSLFSIIIVIICFLLGI
jgi:hypothetical protein